MSATPIDRIAHAVLYEGYMLYPYRPAVKNRQRWTFGGLLPRSYCESAQAGDAWTMRTECLVRGNPTALSVRIRFLHLIDRAVHAIEPPCLASAWERANSRPVESLQVGAHTYFSWQEAMEREAALEAAELGEQSIEREFQFEAGETREPIADGSGNIVGVIVRRQQAVKLAARISSQRVADGILKVRCDIENRTPLEAAGPCERSTALMGGLASTHTILVAAAGEFLSLIDPPDDARALAAACVNVGAWPVLVGDPSRRDTMLAAPIILYDFPQIAPESPGDLFDGTEIDEILSLRILTLSDEEKREAAGLDERVRALLCRTDALNGRAFERMHGAMRPAPAAVPEVQP